LGLSSTYQRVRRVEITFQCAYYDARDLVRQILRLCRYWSNTALENFDILKAYKME
jgi:hypothetical protein